MPEHVSSYVDGGLVWRYQTSGYATAVAADATGLYIAGNQLTVEKRDLQTGAIIWQRNDGSYSPRNIVTHESKIYLLGSGWRIEKRNITDGAIEWTVCYEVNGARVFPGGVAVDNTGLYVVGTITPYQNASNYDLWDGGTWRIEKRNLLDGSVIWALESNPSPKSDYARSVAVDGTGLYIIGSDSNQGLPEWRIEKRSISDGSLIWVQTSNPTEKDDIPYDVAVDASGLYIVGQIYPDEDVEARIEKRDRLTGSLIWSVDSNPTPYGLHLGAAIDDYKRITLDDNGIYLGGHDSILSHNDWGYPEWRIEKRSKEDGASLWVQTDSGHGDYNSLEDLTVFDSNLYIVGNLGVYSWSFEKRNTGLSRAPLLSDFNTFYLKNPSRILFPSTSEDKPLGCQPADVMDSASLGSLVSMIKTPIPALDTSPEIISEIGQYRTNLFEDIITTGGPLVNPLVRYAEDDNTPNGDRAPIKWSYHDGFHYFHLANGAVVPDNLIYEDGAKNLEFFVIEIYRDIAGRANLVFYGFTQRGTVVAGKYFERYVYPNLTSYSYHWIIVEWTDNNWDGFDDPVDGDSYQIIAYG